MPDAIGLGGERTRLLGPANGVAAAAAAEDDADDEDGGGGGRSGDAELLRVGVGGAGLGSRRALREPSSGDLEGRARFGMAKD